MLKATCLFAMLSIAANVHCLAQSVEAPKLIAEDVQCRGNQAVSCEFIRGHLHLAAGDILSEDEVRNAQLRLASLRTFESVSIHLARGSARNKAVVVIEVQEADPIAMEFLAGTSARLEANSSVLGGRIAHQNLFKAGKIADLSLLAITPLGGDAVEENYSAVLRYADPSLFGRSRYFAIASVRWQNYWRRDIHGNFSSFEGTLFDLRAGRRFGDFSYVTAGIANGRGATWNYGEWKHDGVFNTLERRQDYGLSVIYGWNSEDDLYFPTAGSSFHIGAGWDFGSGTPRDRSHVQFRKTWLLGQGFLAVKVGGAPSPEYRTLHEESQLFALSYARPLHIGESVNRGRWYVEPGFGLADRDPRGDRIHEIGIKAGVRLDMRGWGIVDLYVMGSQNASR
jgi:outer membrane translocation and assembly module TamA